MDIEGNRSLMRRVRPFSSYRESIQFRKCRSKILNVVPSFAPRNTISAFYDSWLEGAWL